MSDCALNLCGHVRLTGDDASSPPPPLGSKALALLAYLALEPRAHTRDALTTLLWGDFAEERARVSFRQALSHLRAALGDRLHVDRASVTLAGPISCDVLDFLRDAEVDPAAALRTDVSRFLDGLALRHCPGFEEWADGMRRALGHRYAQALATVARDALARRDWRAAAELGERWCALEPLAEPAARLTVEAYHLGGARAAALAAFARYRGHLHAETGREPGAAVRELVRQVEASRDAPSHASSPTVLPPGAGAPVLEGSLHGRAAEWERLRAAWTAAHAGQSSVVLVEGEAGMGKSRLVGDFGRWVSASGGVVLAAHASEAGSRVPFAPLVELLHAAGHAPGAAGADPQWIAEVARLVPSLARRFPGSVGSAAGAIATPVDRWRLFEGVAQLLIAVAEEGTVGIVLDDLHWCDADSCALLHFLVQRLDGVPILWCLTLTLGAVERDAAAMRLERALRADATVLELEPLGEHDVLALVCELGRLSGPAAAGAFARRLHESTAGNPFYLLESLRMSFAEGRLHVDPASGAWTGLAAWAVAPPGASRPLHGAIAGRISGLADDAREVLATLAVGGAGCSVEVLSHVHGISRLRAAALGDALVERHLAVEAGGLYRCTPAVSTHVVGAELTTTRRREVHRAIALALELLAEPENASSDASPAGEIARHAEQGGERRLAHRHALRASEAAVGRGAYAEALGWLQIATRTATTTDDTRAVDRATAALVRRAGWTELPAGPAATTQPSGRPEGAELGVELRL